MKTRTYRKKICAKCGRYLWLRDFYKMSDAKNYPDGYDCRCKECRRQTSREVYARKRKVADGIKRNTNGALVIKKGNQTRLYWGELKMQDFKRIYPYNTNEDVAIQMECSIRTVVRRARELGLEKDANWLRAVWNKNRRMAHFVNTLPSTRKADLTNFIEGGKKHRFKKQL